MNKILITTFFACLYFTAFGQRKDSSDQLNLRSSFIKPQLIVKSNPNRYFIDFGKDAFGTLILNFDTIPSDKLIIHLGEKLRDKYTIDKNPGGTIRYKKVVLKDIPVKKSFQLQLPPDGRNDKKPAVMLPDTFGRVIPFRYCEIENLKIPIEKVNISQKVFNYRFNDNASSFTSSDTVLNQVWDLCKHTIKATSFCGLYIDGDRERIPYEADAYINQLSHYAVDYEYGIAKETIKYFFDHPTWPTEWLLHTIFMVYQDYYYTGDIEIIKEYYEPLKLKTLYELADKDGLISSFSDKINGEYMRKIGFADTTQRIRDIVDWPPAQKDTGWKLSKEEGERDGHEMLPINTVVNCFFYENMRILAELAAVLENEKDAEHFKQMALKTKKAINEKLFNSEKGRYIDGVGSTHSSLHSNMLALAFDIVPEKYKQSVVEYVKTRGMGCSVYGSQYLLEGLYRAGASEYALCLMTSTKGDRNWWNMIRIGSTMTLEAWDIGYKPNLDWNHAWATAPLNIISRYLWGIKPEVPGFEKVQIKPQMASLTSCSIKVPTIKGPILGEYKKSDKSIIYNIELPEGILGEFILINKEMGKLLLNGKQISKPEILELQGGMNKIEIIY